MYKLLTALLLLPILAIGQTHTSVDQGATFYRFKNGIKPDSALFLPRKDTATTDTTMLAPGMLVYRPLDSLLYWRKGNAMTPIASGVGSLGDYYTKSESDGRFVHYSDTTLMLSPYMRKIDTTAMLIPYLRKADTSAMLLPYLKKIDTASMLSSYVRSTRSINTTPPLSGGGNLSADRTLSIANAQADGENKGAATFRSDHFDDDTQGAISLDTINGPFIRKLDSAAMLAPYVRTGYAHYDTLILKRPNDSTRIDLRLPVVNPVWWGAVPGDGISDRNAIQAAIDYAAGRGMVISGPGQWDIDSTIVLPGKTTWLLHDGAKIYLMDGSDCNMVSNANKTTSLDKVIKDSLITITGGQWYGNGDEQVKLMPDGSNVCGFWFSGVKNVILSPKKVFNTQTYAFEITNCEAVIVENVEVDQGQYAEPLHNQDGVHFDGPCRNIIIRNCILKTFDDCISVCTESVPVGPYVFDGSITGVLIDNIIFNGTRKGIRLLSGDSSLNNVIVSNITGTAIDNVLEASDYDLGPGAFGKIILSNVNVSMTSPIFNNEYIAFDGKIQHISLSNISRVADNNTRNGVKIKATADIGLLEINAMHTHSDTSLAFTDILSQSGAKISRMVIDGYHFTGGRPGKSTALAFNGTTFNTLDIRNSSFDSLLTAIAISTSSLKQLRLTDNNAYKVYNAVFLNASPIADTLHLYGSVMVDTLNNAFSTAGFASIGRIKSYLPTVSVPGSTATFAPIKYTYSSTQYSLNPVSTIDLQTVTNVSGLTTNMTKVTGANNVKNGNGVELFASGGTGTVWSFDRGGTNTLQPLLVGGTPVMLNNRVLVGVSATTTDDANTTLQVKGSFAPAITTTGSNLSLTGAHHTVKLTATGLTITLPSAASAFGGVGGRIYCIVNPNGATSTVSTYNALAGGTSTTIPANSALWLQSNGTTWDQIK